MKKVLFTFYTILILAVLVTNAVIAADVAGLKPLDRPAKFTLPVSNDDLATDISSVSDEERMNMVWEVYSDRANNMTFTSPELTEPMTSLGFLDQLFVIEEQDERLHVVRDTEFGRDSLSATAEDCGWIEKSKLLLWNHNLVTEQGKINRKAMILNTVEQLKSESEDDQPDIVRFRQGPGTEAPFTGEESRLFQFFYIYKVSEDGQAVLLGRNSFFGTSIINKVLVGWAPRSRSIFWFNRIAVEPNWEARAVAERKSGDKATFFAEQLNARAFKNGQNVRKKSIIWNNDPLVEDRLIGEWRRFPVLRDDEEDADILTTGVMGDIYTSDGKLLAKENQKIAEMKRKVDNIIAEKRSIKIAFVVDGTKSMSPVFKAVSQGIKEATKNLNLQYRDKYGENAIDFAGVIYRDYTEDRQRRLRTRGFNSSLSFDDFFNPAEARDMSNNTYPEAMYYGLESALKGLGLNKDETNVIILIGDAGNHYPDAEKRSADAIAQLMADKFCHFIAIQVNHPATHKTYEDFIYQNKVIAMSAAKKYRTVLTGLYKEIYDLTEPKWEEDAGRYNLVESPLGAKVIGLKDGETLNETQIQQEIEQFIKGVDASNDSLIAKMNRIVSGAGFSKEVSHASDKESDFYTLPFAEGIWAVFQQSGLTLEELATLKVDKYQVYTPGFTTVHVNSQAEPIYKRVLLMDQTELGDLERVIRQLVTATTGSARREALYQTWLQILKEYLGESSSEELLQNMSLEEINEKLWELPGTHSMLSNITLKDIHDEHKFTDRQLNDYINMIMEKHTEIQNIFFSRSYNYGFRSNERPYYWIEETILP